MKSLLWKTQRSKVDKILETEPGYLLDTKCRLPLYTKKVLAIKLRKLNTKN
jgi:hypothetical protein